MRLKPGDRAPTFEVTDRDGATVNLSALLQQKRVWLAFFRFVTCPMCNLRLHELASAWPRVKTDDVEMIAIFQSTPASVADWLTENRPPVRVVADPEMDLYRQYGVETSVLGAMHPATMVAGARAVGAGISLRARPEGPLTRVPADFLIDRDGTVKDAFYGAHIAEHIPLERVQSFIAA